MKSQQKNNNKKKQTKNRIYKEKINEKYNNRNKNSMDGLNNRMKGTGGNNH